MKQVLKHLVVICLFVFLLCSFAACSNATDATISNQTMPDDAEVKDITTSKATEETSESMGSVDATKGEVIVYDDKGLLIEYRGILHSKETALQISLYFENNTDKDLYISFGDCLINRSGIGLGNTAIHLPANSVYLVGPNYNYVIDIDDLEAYGIDVIETVSFELEICENKYYGEEFLILPITIIDNVSIYQ
ncbi:MAG: hypothetical protein E7523_04550 [Ruminococcaceae bacterium]|nr:hypothetical protein [Oscillospiraceae bacterium]